MNTQLSAAAPVLTSWKEVARYMGKGMRTVQRWEQGFGLPVRRPRGSNKKAILARPCDLDAWIAIRCGTRAASVPRDRHAVDCSLFAQSSLAAEIETSRLLRSTNRVLTAEVRTAIEHLHQCLCTLQSRV